MTSEMPKEFSRMGEAASEINMSPEVKKLIKEGYEVVNDTKLIKKIAMLPPDGVVEEWTPSIEDLAADKGYDYRVVLDNSGVSEAMKGKPTYKLLRKKK